MFATLATISVLLALCYYPMLWNTAKWIVLSDDMAYGFFAPVIALYIAWQSRDAVLRPNSAPSLWALGFIGFAACLAVFATLASSSTFSRIAFLISLAGCLLLAGGWRTLRRFAFPLSLLLFTFPVPDVFYSEMTQPLQLLATRISEFLFEVLGYSVIREGNILQLTHMKLSVVEACSGLRSLITLFFLCLIYSYFFEIRFWQRIAILFLSIPSAILVNSFRITSTGILGKYNMTWTEGTYHEMVGWTAFAVGFFLVVACHQAFRRILIPRMAGAAV